MTREKVKKIFLYFIALFIVWFGASFVANHYIDYAEVMDLSDEMLYAAALRNEAVLDVRLDELLRLQADESEETDEVVYALGDADAEILNVKMQLYYAEYLETEPKDEVYDEELVEAVKRYQQTAGLEITGNITEETLTSLMNEEMVMKPGQSGTGIKRYLDILFNLDYLSDTPGTYFNEMAAGAVRAYQQDRQLIVNGMLDERTRTRLDEEKYVYREGMRGEDILALQEMLAALGYLQGSADGLYGQGTAQAVRAFQEENNIMLSGEMDEYTKLEIKKAFEAMNAPADRSGGEKK